MIKIMLRCTLIILVISVLASSEALRGSSGKGYAAKPGKNAGKNDVNKEQSPKGKVVPVNGGKLRRGLGISAWGIVSIIITLILSGMGLYYFSMCYPILCRKQRKYDIIELPKV